MKKISSSTRVTEADSLARNILDVYNRDSHLATLPYLSKKDSEKANMIA